MTGNSDLLIMVQPLSVNFFIISPLQWTSLSPPLTELANLFDYSNHVGQSERQIDEVINLSNTQSANDGLFLTF